MGLPSLGLLAAILVSAQNFVDTAGSTIAAGEDDQGTRDARETSMHPARPGGGPPRLIQQAQSAAEYYS
jgi:hypothetical protein